MKVLLLAALNSAHTIKWANALNANGVKVSVAGLLDYDSSQFHPDIETFSFNISKNINSKNYGSYSKLLYLKVLPGLKKIIKSAKPDILHSHLATSYGLLGALTKFHPYIVSVWGFDVYSFPQKSIVHRKTLEWVFKRADLVLSTSHIMATETSKYTNKKVSVTPFGIDTEKFKPVLRGQQDECVIGTVKSLEMWYGIDYLLRAFQILRKKYPERKLKLLIVGGGSLMNHYKELASQLKIDDVTRFTGFIPYKDIATYHNMLDIYVAVSTYPDESFGVAILEASASGKPVIVSSVGGLPEVVMDGETGIIVPPKDEIATAEAIETFLIDNAKREKMGKAGREFVINNYDLNNNVMNMISIYKSALL